MVAHFGSEFLPTHVFTGNSRERQYGIIIQSLLRFAAALPAFPLTQSSCQCLLLESRLISELPTTRPKRASDLYVQPWHGQLTTSIAVRGFERTTRGAPTRLVDWKGADGR